MDQDKREELTEKLISEFIDDGGLDDCTDNKECTKAIQDWAFEQGLPPKDAIEFATYIVQDTDIL